MLSKVRIAAESRFSECGGKASTTPLKPGGSRSTLLNPVGEYSSTSWAPEATAGLG